MDVLPEMRISKTSSKASVVIRALKNTVKHVEKGSDTRIVFGQDPTFMVPIVYAYADFDTYCRLSENLFVDSKHSEVPARGYSSFGSGKVEGFNICLIWMNNNVPLLDTIPTCIHEIVHMSQDVLAHAGVKDASGEVQAYTVERESARVLKKLYGINMPAHNVTKEIRRLVNANAKSGKQGC